MNDWHAIKYFLEVARTQRASAAATRLGVQHSTVSRRIRALEHELQVTLFEKSRVSGFTLTEEGHKFLSYAEKVESALLAAQEAVSGFSQMPTGHIRIGSTEGFGSTVLTPLLVDFQSRYASITLDIMPVPRFISLSKREADIAIALERPQRGPYLCTKLADYKLKLYGATNYLQQNPVINKLSDLNKHKFIGYVDELLFSEHLRYLDNLVQPDLVNFRSTSILAQFQAVLGGHGLAILPCFIAEQNPNLQVILADEIQVKRSFWMYCHEDLRQTRRVMALWNYLKHAVDINRPLLNGLSKQLIYPANNWDNKLSLI